MKVRIKWRALGRMLTLLFAGCLFTACSSGSNDPVPPTLELNPATSINFTKFANDQHQLTITTGSDVSWEIYDSECSDWLSISQKSGKGKATITLTTKGDNKKGEISVSLEVVATNEAGQVPKKIAITRDPGISDAYARQTDAKLIMSYGMACAVESSSSTSYFKYNVYTADVFRNYEGNDDAIAQEATKSEWQRENIPSDGSGVEIMYNDCQPATDYVFVTVAYDREGNRGEINTYPFATKDALEDNQPRVSVTPKKSTVEEVHDENNGPWYIWDTNVDGGGKFYITYACASDKIVETMLPHNNTFGVPNNRIGLSLAWNILMESKNDPLEKAREVTFNKDNASGREKLFGKAFNNKTQWIEYRSTDKYLQIVTWAFKSEDFSNPSGVVSDVLYHVDNGVLREVETPIEYYVKVAPTTLSFGAVPSNAELSVDSNDSWKITSNQSWCKIDGEQTKEGSGAQKVMVTVTQNESENQARTAVITISGNNTSAPVNITVTQEPKVDTVLGKDDYDADKDLDGGQSTYTLTISPTNMTLVPAGEQKSITLTGSDTWTASSNQSWCSLSKSNGTGNATINVSVTKNTTTAQRTATVTITGGHTGTKTVSVTQQAYTLTATPTSLTMDSTADSKTVSVSSNGQWTASSSQSWCTLSPSSGTNNGTVTVKVTANTTVTARTATVTIRETNSNKTVAITVTQSGGTSVGRDEYDPDKNL